MVNVQTVSGGNSGCKSISVLQESSVQLRHELATQQRVNKQLMQRKQEVEWQLMAAVAEVCLLLYWIAHA